MRILQDIKTRLESYFRKTSSCWIWQGAITNSGYGSFSRPGRKGMPAHVAAYELYVGEVPAGMVLDHLCKNRLCVNPDHLEIVTQQENLHRSDNFTGVNKRKTHCIRNHPFSGSNLYVTPDGRRQCRECARMREMGSFTLIKE